MRSVYVVTCITKDDRDSRNERIYQLGIKKKYPQGLEQLESARVVSAEEAIRLVNAGAILTTSDSSFDIPIVEVVHSGRGGEYLRTKANRILGDNLLSMPDCPKSTSFYVDMFRPSKP